MALTVEEIHGLYREHGHVAYSGEPVTQLEHALQSGLLAEEAGADEALVAAAFLHDLGHLLNRQGETPSARGIDDLHQYYVLPFLRPLFSDAVLEPICTSTRSAACAARTPATSRACRRTRCVASRCRAASSVKRRPRRSCSARSRRTHCVCAAGTTRRRKKAR